MERVDKATQVGTEGPATIEGACSEASQNPADGGPAKVSVQEVRFAQASAEVAQNPVDWGPAKVTARHGGFGQASEEAS